MNSDNLSAPETISLLERVVTGIESFAGRENGIERARQLRDSNQRQSLEEGKLLLQKEHNESLKQLEEEVDEKIGLVSEILDERRARIDRAQIAVRNEVIAEMQKNEGARKGKLQSDFMQAGKQRDRELARAAEVHEEEIAQSKKVQNGFIRIEKKAVRSLRGFAPFQRSLIAALKAVEVGEGDALSLEKLTEVRIEMKARVERFGRQPLVGWFNAVPLALQVFLFLAIGGALPFLLPPLGGPAIPLVISLVVAGVLALITIVLFFTARSQASHFLGESEALLIRAKEWRLRFKGEVGKRNERALAQIESSYAAKKRVFDAGLKGDRGVLSGHRYDGPDAVADRAEVLRAKLSSLKERQIGKIRNQLAAITERLEAKRDRRLAALTESGGGGTGELARQFDLLTEQWEESIVPAHQKLIAETGLEVSHELRPQGAPSDWEPPAHFSESLVFGALSYDGSESEGASPKSEALQIEGAPDYKVPLRLRIPDAGSVLLETKDFGRDASIEVLNNLVLGWLAGSPAGRLSFSFVDPVGLGESFAGLMHLADYEEILIDSRIRTQPEQIEKRLGELTEHMEKVIQMYLRSDYETITQYNEAAGTIAERYHFLVVADFPHGFTELAAKRLLSIAASGARCGVFLLIHHDERGELPRKFPIGDIRKECVCVRRNMDSFFLRESPVPGTELKLIRPPAADLFAKWVHRIGEANRDSNRIEVPFSFIAPDDSQVWSGSTLDELRVPIGRSGATKLQDLALGKGTKQHALIAGKTGSGKSTLFHIMVTNLALWCDPDEVEFYLIDFKKGVEFKCYADYDLPHARVIAIESDREFGLSVLRRLDEELQRRGDLFRAAGVQDVPNFRAKNPDTAMQRTLLLVDEFQEFFTVDDAISQQAAVLLDRIVRQGRAFGIHAVLGSQTLGGAFTLARATLGQMTVRVALACNEADAYLIMDDSNPAPRLLTRPGEGIYNDRAGAAEANSPFQVVWLGEEERNAHLETIRTRQRTAGREAGDLVVFEGNAPADITTDREIAAVREGRDPAKLPRFFLGAPNAIKGPTVAPFSRQSGSNLLFVGQRDDAIDAMVASGLALLGSSVRKVLIDNRFSQPDDDSWFVEAIAKLGEVECPGMHEMIEVINALAAELKSLSEGNAGPPAQSTVLVIPSLHRYKKLRYEEDFSFSMNEEAEVKPGTSLQELITEGPSWGYHVVASVDSYNNANRALGRKAIGEFEKKVLFQMSAADSATLIDTGAAADLGMNRALFYDEPSGVAEIFRPWAPAPLDWFE